ncbi:MAG: hypothetical protein EOP85_11155 [Verrucomicrobiaceae bacterium]|nr:MAG: hypothetical protein EOP85_11155 [Verrucomicrobiaceae bacterium]
MKTLLIAILSLFTAAGVTLAGVADRLTGGTWRDLVTITADDDEEITLRVAAVYKRYRKTGIESVTTIRASSGVRVVETLRYKPNGLVYGETKRNGVIVAYTFGEWWTSKRMLSGSLKSVGPGGRGKYVSRILLTSDNRLTISNKKPGGELSISSMKRR